MKLSEVLRLLWSPASERRPVAAEAIIIAIAELEQELFAARADAERQRLFHEAYLLSSRTTRRRERASSTSLKK